MATHAGADVNATAAVTTRIRDHRTHVVLTTRLIPVNSIETRLLQAWTNPKWTNPKWTNPKWTNSKETR